jgi:hypothetical protein
MPSLALLEATKAGNYEEVAEMLREGEDPNIRCPTSGLTPLIASLLNNDDKLRTLLLSHPVSFSFFCFIFFY